jgi:hypothetical protein
MALTGQDIIRTMATFQLLSDLHLETETDAHNSAYSTYTITPSAPYLILAGDIGELFSDEQYAFFLWRHIDHFKHIYVVLGNHEYHHMEYHGAQENAKLLETSARYRLEEKVTFLMTNAARIPELKITIIGATLHTFIPDSARDEIATRIKDFSLITNWDTTKHNHSHFRDLQFIRTCIAGAPADDRILVVTHHSPTLHNYCAPQYHGSGISNAFATEILNATGPDSFAAWEGREKVKVWAYGHTHYCTDWIWNPPAEDMEGVPGDGVRIGANQRGYVKNGRETGVGFNPTFTFEI